MVRFLFVGFLIFVGGARGEESVSLTLPDAVRLALAKNYTITVEALSPKIAEANVSLARGRFDPVFQASYEYAEDGRLQATDPFTGNRPPSSLIKADTYDAAVVGSSPWGMSYRLGATTQNRRGTFNAFADQYSSFAGLSVTQPVLKSFGFGSNLYQVRIARVDQATSEWDYRETAINVITAVIYRYNDLQFARRILETAKRSRDLAAGLLDENERRFRVGSMSESDVTAARSRVAQREESILISAQAVRESENSLKQLISDDRSPELLKRTLVLESLPPAAELEVDAARDFKRALENRPDYQRARLQTKRAELTRTYAANQRLPQVDLVASLGYSGLNSRFSESRQQVEDRDTRSYSAGVVLGIPLTFAQERARYRSAKLTLRQTEVQLAALEQAIVVAVGNAASQIETTRQRVGVARVARELAEKNLEAEVKRLRAGPLGSTFIVLQSQEILTQIETREFQALSDARKAIAEYDRQLGLTLQTFHVTLE